MHDLLFHDNILFRHKITISFFTISSVIFYGENCVEKDKTEVDDENGEK